MATTKEPIGILAKRWKMRKLLNDLRDEGLVLTPAQRQALSLLPRTETFTAHSARVGSSTLTMFEKQGLVAGAGAEEDERDASGRVRKGRVYEITERGIEVQERLKKAAAATIRVRSKFVGGDWDA